jgi:hypothetical protein
MANEFTSLFGGIEKAKLCFEIKRVSDEDIAKGVAAAAFDANRTAVAAKMGATVTGKKNTEFLPSDPKIVSKGTAELIVQYNPASLRIESNAKKMQIKGMLENLQGLPNMKDRNASIVLSVDLIFDAVQNQDAFRQDRISSVTSPGPSSIVSGVGAIGKLASGTPYSVLPQTRLIIGAISLMPLVTFVWGDQKFSGITEFAQVKFEMFSPSGHPIRSKVTLRIQQNISENDSKQISDWTARYEKFFSNDPKAVKLRAQHGKSVLQNQSVLNV